MSVSENLKLLQIENNKIEYQAPIDKIKSENNAKIAEMNKALNKQIQQDLKSRKKIQIVNRTVSELKNLNLNIKVKPFDLNRIMQPNQQIANKLAKLEKIAFIINIIAIIACISLAIFLAPVIGIGFVGGLAQPSPSSAKTMMAVMSKSLLFSGYAAIPASIIVILAIGFKFYTDSAVRKNRIHNDEDFKSFVEVNQKWINESNLENKQLHKIYLDWKQIDSL